MKKCPACERGYSGSHRFCPVDGEKLVDSTQEMASPYAEPPRAIPPPPEPLPMRMTIIDQGDEGNRSRVINGQVLDVAQQGMRIKTGTIETGHLNVIRDDTVAFKNLLDLEIELPSRTIRLMGFAAWYKPADDGINWTVGIYIRNMSTSDRKAYDEYLAHLASRGKDLSAPAGSAF